MNWNGRLLRLWASVILLVLAGTVLCEENVDPDVAQVRIFLNDVVGTSQRSGRDLQEGRTFGHKRIQFMLMPMVYKMGVIMTMLAVLTVISLKGLMIGVILLVLKLSAIFGKLYASWGHGHSQASWAPPQPVHVHVHGDGGYGPHSQAYGGWEHVHRNGWESAPSGAPPGPEETYYYRG